MPKFLKLSAPLLLLALLPSGEAQNDLFDIQKTLYGAPIPDCGDPGQNESFQGRPLTNKKGECDKINICHGTAGGGQDTYKWNLITVSRSSNGGLPGHRGYNHNLYEGKGKLPDYYPGGVSVPNPNGAGKYYGRIDEACNFVPDPREEGEAAEPVPPEAMTEEEKTTLQDDLDEAEKEEEADAQTTATPPAPPGTFGDPHFVSFGGEKFDFHGGCDMVLLQNPSFANGLGLDVHIRTKIKTWWSHIETAVLRVGEHTLEVSGGDSSRYWINGGDAHDFESGQTSSLSDFEVKFRKVNDHQGIAHIDFGDAAISIETYKDFVRVNVKTSKQLEGTVGLLGSFPEGKMVGRDKSTILNDANEFGLEWQVLGSEPMLFHSVGAVKPPMTCTMPNRQKSEKRRLGESSISVNDATLACARVDEGNRDACIFDVLATNDKGMAGSY